MMNNGITKAEGARIVAERRSRICRCGHLEMVHVISANLCRCLVNICECEKYEKREEAPR
jgi:hypothetical protein